MSILETQKLCKNFSGLAALSHVDITIEKGEIRGLIGPNGAGKTTLFNVISGYYKPSSGKVMFDGKDITGLKPNVVAGLGLVRTFQATILFHEMTVLQNVSLGFHLPIRPKFFSSLFNTPYNQRKTQEIHKKALELLEFMELDTVKDEYAKNLPHGNQRALAILISLAANPKLLLLDEPFTGMNPKEKLDMMNRTKKIREQMNTTIVIVEHDMKAILELSDRITVLNYGEKIVEGLPQEVVENRNVIEAYLGIDEGA
jgi:branched-chain amino acid transport system ATP-binding protein